MFLEDRLVKSSSLPEGDLKAKQLRVDRKEGCDALQSLLCVDDEGSVVCKMEVPGQPLQGLSVGLQTPQIEEAVIHTVPDIHPIFIIHIIRCLLEQNYEEDTEESRCQITTLLHAVGEGKGLQQATIVSVVPLLALRSHWLSGRSSSTMVSTSLLGRTLASTLPAMDCELVPR